MRGGISAAGRKKSNEGGDSQAAPAPAAPRASEARRGGRPPVLSRDLVLGAALEIARQAPEVPVSISAIARSLSVTPMALYTYFGNRDELMQALSAKLLEGFVVDVSAGALPVDQVLIWARELRRYCLDHPELLSMLTWEGGRSSAAWLNKSRPLFEAAEALGFRGEALGRMMLWLWSAIMIPIKLEILLRQTERATYDEATFDPAIRDGVKMVHLVTDGRDQHERNFEFQIAQMVKAIGTLPG